ncbi:cob(I)yrinic acid a,c-diamide adenosyltransferase [Propionicicella superfundia]|uniref:cob(I)yrinic acid a,c-diamide adenosyltransferase n=1 Tax=Propionicicella superfundia TaxID=348582 RepID=UPI0004066581|nr:cob(I)yrinic acid a,c-diamide adenosyltransferase [Propionicicella superfundia]
MVTLTRIYTRNGDAGQTRLSDMSLASKTDPRVEAYGAVDEANSVIGLALATGDLRADMATTLREIQNELFDVGADLSNPLARAPKWEPLRIVQSSVDRLEAWCDSFAEELPALTSFILPGGTPAAATLHLARTVVRRAERAAWAAVEVYGTDEGTDDVPGGISVLAIAYLNRLSDLLFILARVAADGAETLWVPGKDREPTTAKARRQRERIVAQQAEQPAPEDA